MHFSCQLRPEVFSISTEGLPTFFIDVKFKRLHENRLKQQNDKNNDICQELETTEMIKLRTQSFSYLLKLHFFKRYLFF